MLGALGARVEGTDRVDLVAEEVEPDRELGAGHEDVDDAAPAGERAGLLDEW